MKKRGKGETDQLEKMKYEEKKKEGEAERKDYLQEKNSKASVYTILTP